MFGSKSKGIMGGIDKLYSKELRKWLLVPDIDKAIEQRTE
jgi:hypothetical protein